MKLYLINDKHYVVALDFADAEKIYREQFEDYQEEMIKSIIKISDNVIERK